MHREQYYNTSSKKRRISLNLIKLIYDVISNLNEISLPLLINSNCYMQVVTEHIYLGTGTKKQIYSMAKNNNNKTSRKTIETMNSNTIRSNS